MHVSGARMSHGRGRFANFASMSRSGAVWNAIWATWAGLQMNIEPIRFSLFWIALEALFGLKTPER